MSDLQKIRAALGRANASLGAWTPRYKFIDDALAGIAEALALIDGMEPQTKAASDVLAERRRQVEVEGWTAKHDDKHDAGEMAAAAACYATSFSRYWPWAREWWKPKDRRRNLIRAGALILAEIERLDRLVTAPDASADRQPEASTSRREKSNDRGGERPPPQTQEGGDDDKRMSNISVGLGTKDNVQPASPDAAGRAQNVELRPVLVQARQVIDRMVIQFRMRDQQPPEDHLIVAGKMVLAIIEQALASVPETPAEPDPASPALSPEQPEGMETSAEQRKKWKELLEGGRPSAFAIRFPHVLMLLRDIERLIAGRDRDVDRLIAERDRQLRIEAFKRNRPLQKPSTLRWLARANRM